MGLMVKNRTSMPFVKDFDAGLEHAKLSAGGGRKGNETQSKQRNRRELPLGSTCQFIIKPLQDAFGRSQRIRQRRIGSDSDSSLHGDSAPEGIGAC